jgi:hypothetical protein
MAPFGAGPLTADVVTSATVLLADALTSCCLLSATFDLALLVDSAQAVTVSLSITPAGAGVGAGPSTATHTQQALVTVSPPLTRTTATLAIAAELRAGEYVFAATAHALGNANVGAQVSLGYVVAAKLVARGRGIPLRA